MDTKGAGAKVLSIDSGATVKDAVALMNRHVVGSVIVLDGERLVGIFTERDVLTRIVAVGRDPGAVRVGEVMTRKVLVIDRDTSVTQAMTLMTTRRCRHLPVLDQGKLVAVISIGDLTRWVIHDRERSIADLEDYIHRS
ncbi:MAG TPA: CBS domain-containing protein [Kofleriaceae bacterium]|nr:CBS domain-containing protein [Kofleriaceae bacterium]